MRKIGLVAGIALVAQIVPATLRVDTGNSAGTIPVTIVSSDLCADEPGRCFFKQGKKCGKLDNHEKVPQAD